MEFNIDSIRKNKIELLDCQVEVVLKCLEFYCYTANFMNNRKHKYESVAENFKICLITDTYHQIMRQFSISESENPIKNNTFNSFEKIS